MIGNETRGEARLRHLQTLIPGLRRRILTTLSDEQQRECEAFFEQVEGAVRRSTSEQLETLSSSHLTDEGKRQRIAQIYERESEVLDHLVAETQKLSDKLAETRRAALAGFVAHESGFAARKPTPKEDANRTYDLLMCEDEPRRRDIFLTACRRGQWDVIDAVETAAPKFRPVVDVQTVEVGRNIRLAESPRAPAIRALESVVAMRAYVTESVRAEITDVR